MVETHWKCKDWENRGWHKGILSLSRTSDESQASNAKFLPLQHDPHTVYSLYTSFIEHLFQSALSPKWPGLDAQLAPRVLTKHLVASKCRSIHSQAWGQLTWRWQDATLCKISCWVTSQIHIGFRGRLRSVLYRKCNLWVPKSRSGCFLRYCLSMDCSQVLGYFVKNPSNVRHNICNLHLSSIPSPTGPKTVQKWVCQTIQLHHARKHPNKANFNLKHISRQLPMSVIST